MPRKGIVSNMLMCRNTEPEYRHNDVSIKLIPQRRHRPMSCYADPKDYAMTAGMSVPQIDLFLPRTGPQIRSESGRKTQKVMRTGESSHRTILRRECRHEMVEMTRHRTVPIRRRQVDLINKNVLYCVIAAVALPSRHDPDICRKILMCAARSLDT